MTAGKRKGAVWQVSTPEPVGPCETLIARLRHAAAGGAAVLGVDLPLGLPRAYAAAHVAEVDFQAFLQALVTRPGFFEVCETLEEVSPARPFYPMRGRRGMTRLSHAAALGLGEASGLSRACDRATAERPAGAPLFWTLGANQTGKGAITAWRDWLIPALARNDPPLLWPFAGDLAALLSPGAVVVAEAYPAEILRHLGLVMRGSKRRQSDRMALAPALRAVFAGLSAMADPTLEAAITDGFGADAMGEDRFDSVIGVLGVINVVAGNRSGCVPDDPWIRRWEGWVLGQTSLPQGWPCAGPGSPIAPPSAPVPAAGDGHAPPSSPG
jgi:hypothetical protein